MGSPPTYTGVETTFTPLRAFLCDVNGVELDLTAIGEK